MPPHGVMRRLLAAECGGHEADGSVENMDVYFGQVT